MKAKRIPAAISLIIGDVVTFYAALWLALFVRSFQVPSSSYYLDHVYPFTIVAIAWILSLYVIGLYETESGNPRARVPSAVLAAGVVGVLASVLVFYVVPFFEIAPKTILALHIVFVALGLWAWRVQIEPRLSRADRRTAIIIGGGPEFHELYAALSSSASFHPLKAVAFYDLETMPANAESIDVFVREQRAAHPKSAFVVDVAHPRIAEALPRLYELSFSGMRIIELRGAYEEEFKKVVVTAVDHRWLLAHASGAPRTIYDIAKRIVDAGVALIALVIVSPILLLAAIAIKIEDGGPVFIKQKRVGRFGKLFVIRKLRTMTGSEHGAWVGETKLKVTKVGSFLRRTSIDELPQFISILSGYLSLTGPRPDISGLDERLAAEIPYYRARYLAKPGLSGWAQVHQKVVPQTVEQSRERLAYDLYYIRRRSFSLDIQILIATLRALVRRMVG
jgi:lipopolysaccharide/colanic/teichoic acid biosynthesis glycosyltransferase